MTARPDATQWWHAGERYLAGIVDAIPDADLDAPTLLPNWSRRYLLAHVARNADALGNLIAWARTGVETPMYPSAEAREAGIAQSATQDDDALRADVRAAAQRLADAAAELTDEQWQAEVRTAQGRAVPATEITWMRVREVWVHAVDLDAGAGFRDVPADCLAALVDDVVLMWQRRDEPADITLIAADTGASWTVGTGAHAYTADLPDLVAVVTGRRPADVALPRWI